jgi:hypothetical protein
MFELSNTKQDRDGATTCWHLPRSNWMQRELTEANFTLRLAEKAQRAQEAPRFKSPLAHTVLRLQAGEPPAPDGVVFSTAVTTTRFAALRGVVSKHGLQDGLARPLRGGAERHRDFCLYMR